MARPRKILDEEQMSKCAEKQWTTKEIAAFFRVSEDLLQKRYSVLIAEARQRGTAKLRDLMWQRAINGSDRMLEHIANRFLGSIPSHVKMSLTDLSDEKLAEEMERRMKNGQENDSDS